MINKQRVQRIKNVIYTVLVLLFFLPFILLIALCIGMISFMSDASTSLGRIEEYIVQMDEPDSGDGHGKVNTAGNGQSGVMDISDAVDKSVQDSLADNDKSGVNADPDGLDVSEMLAPGGDGSDTSEDRGNGVANDLTSSALTETADTQSGTPVASGAAAGEDAIADSSPFDAPSTGRAFGEALIYFPNTYEPDTLPDLYFDTIVSPETLSKGTLYLTFDNTPSGNFRDILDVLDKHQVKATFFVWRGNNSPALGDDFRAITEGGHSIGIHSNTKDIPFSELYSSREFFLSQFNAMFEKIYAETGVKTRLYRLPGGSVGSYDMDRQRVIDEVKAELDSRGFLQFDWNASAQDAVYPALTSRQILDNLGRNLDKGDRVIALLHDGTNSDSTVIALDEFIIRCKNDGFEFKAIDYNTTPFFLK